MEKLYLRPTDACSILDLPFATFKHLRNLHENVPLPTVQLQTRRRGARPFVISVSDFIEWLRAILPNRFTDEQFTELEKSGKPISALGVTA